MNTRQLQTHWRARDARYAARRIGGLFAPLTAGEEDSVRNWRHKEIEELPEDERSTAYGVLARWTPPIIPAR